VRKTSTLARKVGSKLDIETCLAPFTGTGGARYVFATGALRAETREFPEPALRTSGNRSAWFLVLAERAMSSARNTIETIFAFDETI
jgi:hypothetical protein